MKMGCPRITVSKRFHRREVMLPSGHTFDRLNSNQIVGACGEDGV
jgi:hypothetical protein